MGSSTLCAPLWEVPLYGRCSLIGGAPFWEVPLCGRHPFMEIHGRCTFMGNASIRCAHLWKVPFYEKCSLVETELPLCQRHHYMKDDPLQGSQ